MFRRAIRPNRRWKRRYTIFTAISAIMTAISAVSLISFWYTPFLQKTAYAEGLSPGLSPVTITGHGFGHGRGMGQWGAFGYAQSGWNYPAILQHFYGDFQFARINTPQVRVQITREKIPQLYSRLGEKVGGYLVRAGYAVWLYNNAAYITQGCTNTVVETLPMTANMQISSAVLTSEDPDSMLRFCSDNAPYRGSMTISPTGAEAKIINTINMEDYLRSVIPSEMPAKWADQRGFTALEAQAICARSYATVVMNTSHELKDNNESQMYIGIRAEDPRTDQAVRFTSGIVMMNQDKVVFSEYSASTGGMTMGEGFPSVLDAGDVISPYHTWTRSLSQVALLQKLGVDHIVSIKPTISGPHSRDGLLILTTDRGARYSIPEKEFSRRFKLPSAWIDETGTVRVY